MLDQVTQAFCPPERRAEADRRTTDLVGADRAQVLRIFEALERVSAFAQSSMAACRSLSPITRTSREPWFRARVAHDWWAGEKLISREWAIDPSPAE